MIYKFDAVWKADGFEACLAAADADHCRAEFRPTEVQQVEPEQAGAGDAAPLSPEQEEV